MLEVEVKYPVADLDELMARVVALGATPEGTRQDCDEYFNAPDRDFAKTNEAFRIRSIGDENCLTYKGPKKPDAIFKTREEIEIAFAPGREAAAQMARLLTNLGYRSVAIVRKNRTTFGLRQEPFIIHITLDIVEEVGTYAEIEIVAEESAESQAQAMILNIAQLLGFRETPSERRSYLQLLLEKRGEQS